MRATAVAMKSGDGTGPASTAAWGRSPDECAACGKTGGGLKACTACRLVRYCGVDCQRAHRKAHKAECEAEASRRLKDIAISAEDSQLLAMDGLAKKMATSSITPNANSVEKTYTLLKPECPICAITLPTEEHGATYHACCGTLICNGCIYEHREAHRALGKDMDCPFCRALVPDGTGRTEAYLSQLRHRVEKNDAEAIYMMGMYHLEGTQGVKRDKSMALELIQRSADLGHPSAAFFLGCCYQHGDKDMMPMVQRDDKKGKQYLEQAVEGNHLDALYHLGIVESSMSHMCAAASAGHEGALECVKKSYKAGVVNKDDLAETLRAYQRSRDDMRSEARDTANKWMAMQVGKPINGWRCK